MTLKEALKMLTPYRRQMMFVIALAIITSAISAVTPFVSSNMIDKGLLAGDIRIVVYLVLLIILLQISGQIVEYLQRKIEIKITNELGKSLKIRAFEHGLKMKPHYFKEEGFYKTISNALFDISGILQITNNSLLTIFVIVCKCVGALVGLFILDWRLSIFVIAILPMKVWLNIQIRKHVEKHSEQFTKDSKAYNAWLSNILFGIIDIKLWNMRKKITNEYASHVQTINESSKRLSLLRAKNNLLITGFEFSWMNALYILGAVLIAREWLTYGGLIAFISFAAYVLSPVNIIMELRLIFKQITPNVEGLKRYYEFEEESYDASLSMSTKTKAIEFKNVSVNLGGRSILQDFNLTVSRGEKVAIVGDNGSGKTTIINLLLRLLEPDKGEIFMDGVLITEYNIEEYRRKFSVVSQDTHLFKGTIKDNIVLDEESSHDADADDRLKFCTEVIEGWEHQYDTDVGSEGVKLSGGERQKVALLRALNRKTDILVLDEPTSNYDIESETEFNRFILEDMNYGFCFIVTHRKDILINMDKVITVEGGRVSVKTG